MNQIMVERLVIVIKKYGLFFITFIPVIIGYIVNIFIMLPFVGTLLFYVLPILTTILWYRIGGQYAEANWKLIPATLISNSCGFVSLVIYLWQFLIQTDETRSMFLAGWSQMFSASVPLYLLGGIARLFETQPNYVGRASMAALQVLALVYMMIVFVVGFLHKKNKLSCI